MAFALEQAIDEAALRLKATRFNCASAGIPIRTGSVSMTGRPGLETWRDRPAERGAATAAASASPRAIGSISGSWARRSSSRSRAAASSPASRRRTSAPGPAASSPTRSRASSGSSRTRSRCASAIRHCRRDRDQAEAASPPRSFPPLYPRGRQTQGRRRPRRPDESRRRDRTRRGANSSPPRPISKSRRSAPRTTPDHLRQQLAPEGRRDDRLDLRLHDAPLFHVAIGAGAPSSVQVVEVEVDTLLGHVRVLRAHTRRRRRQARFAGAGAQPGRGRDRPGVGLRSLRGARGRSPTGDVLTTSLDDYRMPGIGDIPPIDVHFDEGGFDHVLGGSVGIGEVATVPTAAAISNAIRNATGVRPPDPAPARPAAWSYQAEDRRMTAAAHIAPTTQRPNFAPPAPISRSGAAAASRAGRLSTSFRRRT